MSESPYQYWAFISYSHDDSAAAAALHRSLEAYRIPHRLVGKPTPSGPAPRRLRPIFRDREELPSSAELGGVINRALRASRYLIVVCSPRSARSRWVNEEIRYFKSLGRSDRVLALIVDGEPHAGDPLRECFPPALRLAVDRDGRLLDEPVEPIAADQRKHGDGPFLARMKLISGLLGLGLDDLVRRERRRQLRQRIAWTLGIGATLVAGGGALLAQQREFERRQHAAYVDELVEGGRRELLTNAPMRAAVYLAEAYREGVRDPALRFMLHQALQPIDALERVFTGARPGRVDVSRDDRWIAVLDDGGQLTVWSLADGQRVAQFRDPRFVMQRAEQRSPPVFSADGRYVAVAVVPGGSRTGRLVVWSMAAQAAALDVEIDAYNIATMQPFDAGSRRVLGVAPGGRAMLWPLDGAPARALDSPAPVTAATFDPAGERLALGLASGGIEVQAVPHEAGQRLQGLGGAVLSLAFDGRGEHLLASSDLGEVRSWQLPEGRLDFASGHTQRLTQIQFSDDARRILTVAADGMRIWRSEDGRIVYSGSSADERRAGLSPGGTRLAQPMQRGTQMVDVDSAQVLSKFDGDTEEAIFTHRSPRLLTLDAKGQLALWNVGFRPLGEARHAAPAPRATRLWRNSVDFAVLPAGRVVSGGQDGRLRIWAGSTLAPEHEFAEFGAQISRVVASRDGTRIAAAATNGVIEVWDTRRWQRLQRFDTDTRFVSTLLLSADGRHLVAADRSDTAYLWDADSGALRARYAVDTRFALDISADSRLLALPREHRLVVIDLQTLQPRLQAGLDDDGTPPPIGCVRLAPDGRSVVAMADDASGRVRWFSLDDGTHRDTTVENSEGCFAARYDPTGAQVLLLGRWRKSIPLWTPASGRLVELVGHARVPFDADWSADGQFVVTGGSDGRAKLWDARTLKALGDIGVHAGALSTVAFAADGKTVYTSGIDDGRLQAWSFALETRTADEVVGRVHCVSPWALDRTALVPRAVDLGACGAGTGAAP